MTKYKYFELDEFLVSEEAKKRKIDNTPSFEIVDHLDELVGKFLDPLRSAYGKAIFVRSGYRCPKLNEAVGGSPTSAHPLGYAADLQVAGSFEEFCEFVVDWVKKTGVRFDQILIEKNSPGDKWLHIGLYNRSGQQRGQIKTLNV